MTECLSQQLALSILQNCQLPLLVLDKHGYVTSYNTALAQLVGHTEAAELRGCNLADLGKHPLHTLLGDDNRLCWDDHNSVTHHFEIQIFELADANHAQVRLFIDISRQVILEQTRNSLSEQLEQHVLTDQYTGLLNERGIMLALEPQVARSRRYNSNMSIVIFDAHCPTDIENAHPHIASLLKDQLRWADLIGCNNEKEFILVLPETNAESSLQLIEKLRSLLRNLANDTFSGQAISTSVGIAGWRRSDNAETLINRARVALAQSRSEQCKHQPIAL